MGGGRRSCSLTDPSSSRGIYRESGACACTRAAREGDDSAPLPQINCNGCSSSCCVMCFEAMADAVQHFAVEHARQLAVEDVEVVSFTLARVWRDHAHTSSTFRSDGKGGGTFLTQCPACFELTIEQPSVPEPATITRSSSSSSETVESMQPYKHTAPRRFGSVDLAVVAPRWSDDGTPAHSQQCAQAQPVPSLRRALAKQSV